MMRFTKAVEYAIRCVLYLASLKERVASRQEVAYVMEIPDHFLAKIAQQLAKARIIEIRQGRQGGYRLLVSPEDLSLLEVVEAVSGEIFINECVIMPETCRKSPICPVHRIWTKVRDTVREMLRQVSIADLLKEEKNICFRSKKEETENSLKS